MSTEEIIKMAFELGSAISQCSEVEAVKAMQIKISEDQAASELITRYQEARDKAENKMKDGLLVTSSEENHLKILQQQLNNNPMVQEMIQVQDKFNNLMQGVYFALNQAITGENCSSDCSSCGGSCSR